ncbi:hypothetical protein RJT34_30496 [Clitoria ternatea]|uniref:Uncharacterized protein n=1 Tax=Clitoria ternatea TaxID=43366 RepID=A0AAN9I440_CLITE
MNGEGHRQRGTTEKTTAGVARCEEGIARNVLEEGERLRKVLEQGEMKSNKRLRHRRMSHDFCVASTAYIQPSHAIIVFPHFRTPQERNL